jgi:hypothetical protein
VDASALIFLALAVAWAAYLLPLAIKHHAEDDRSRTVDRFSQKMRVIARREPVDRKTARLVTPDAGLTIESEIRVDRKVVRTEAKAERQAARAEARAARAEEAARVAASLTPAQVRARRAATAAATKRRRNVLALLLAATLVVVVLAAVGVLAWPYVAVPVVLLGAWLVLCRVMVKGEQRALAPRRTTADRMPVEGPAEETADEPVADAAPAEVEESDAIDPMEDTSAGIAAIVDPAMWDPVPVTLPTYVTKPAAARRTVRTIDLDSTGVWTSGRTDADAQIAREADEAEKAAKARRDGDDHRAVGS